MAWLDTHTIEKIVYKDVEVFDPADYEIDEEESDALQQEKSPLDDILDQAEPNKSMASRLLKEVGVEVTEEQIEDIQDPALKQLILQKKIQELMARSNTHSAPSDRPFVVSPDEAFK